MRYWPCFCLLLLVQPAYLIAAPGSSGYQPFELRDQNLFNLIHGQALPSNARLSPQSRAYWSSSLTITNTLNIKGNSNEDIYLDYEAWRFNLSYQYGFMDDWNIKIDVPLVYQGGGVFDSAIDNWHQVFGLPRGERPYVANNQYDVRYAYQSRSQLDLNEEVTSLGDIQLAVAHSLIESSSTTMSLWVSLKLPTGDQDKMTGSGAVDYSAWLAVNRRLADNWLINMNAGAVILGDDNYKNIPLSDYALYGHIMLGWLVNDTINLKLQLQGHSSYYDQSQLKILGDTYFLVFGGTIVLSQCSQLDIAMSEDIDVGASPDASLLISWRHASHCSKN
ncbi:MAG: DUF3187 family protein [Gammaproteobacteria bacterium]|nr:DUF3187 family protein [Gammaproteobacteria bacterium]